MSPIPPIFSFLFLLHSVIAIPNPDPAVQPFLTTPSASSPPSTTIPAFPEQSNVAGCRLDLPDDFFRGVRSACTGLLRRSRCCPVLAAWLYAAYSATALGGTPARPRPSNQSSYDLPLLPDDSETCVDNLGKALEERGVELVRPNKTCDLVYCYCNIRLHPLSCPEAFSVNQRGELVGDRSVRRLERACSSNNADQFPGLGGCNNCLNKLYMLNKNTSNVSKLEDKRTTKMHEKDCHLMGITWLLAKNRMAYIHTVSWVLRALMMSTDGSDPQSCTLNSDGMPLAVDSTEFSDQSTGAVFHPSPISVLIVAVSLLLYIMVST